VKRWLRNHPDGGVTLPAKRERASGNAAERGKICHETQCFI
jgi:hypothetical protein